MSKSLGYETVCLDYCVYMNVSENVWLYFRTWLRVTIVKLVLRDNSKKRHEKLPDIRKDQWMAQVWDTNKSPKDPKYEARTKGNHLILASEKILQRVVRNYSSIYFFVKAFDFNTFWADYSLSEVHLESTLTTSLTIISQELY